MAMNRLRVAIMLGAIGTAGGCAEPESKIADEIAATGKTLITATKETELTGGACPCSATHYFGFGVDISDGTRAIGGGPYSDVSTDFNAGAAWVHVRNGSSWSVERKFEIPVPYRNGGDHFGETVAISADGTRVAARPSGTEPKIKFYVSVNGPLASVDAYPDVHAGLEAKIDRILAELKLDS